MAELDRLLADFLKAVKEGGSDTEKRRAIFFSWLQDQSEDE